MIQIEVAPTPSASAIRNYLWNNEALLNFNVEIGPSTHPLGGHCYVASEAFYHIEGGSEYWTPQFQEINWYSEELDSNLCCPHWYLKNERTGNYVDLTAEQFEDYNVRVDYDDGIGKGFVPPSPSNRAQKVINKI